MQRGIIGKHAAAVLSGLLLGSTVLAGCGSTSTQPKGVSGEAVGKNEGSAGKEPFKFTIMAIDYNPGLVVPPDAKKMVEEYTNTQINLKLFPAASYDDKVSTLIASGDFPDVMIVPDAKSTIVLNAIRQGVFWDLTPFLKDYPNIMKLYNQDVQKNMKIDGKHYFISLAYHPKEPIITYRKDWLDKVGMKPPTTVDELYELAKAFTTKDPDGNGKDDTFGLVEQSSSAAFHRVKVWLGAPNNWGVKDGKLYPDFFTEEYVAAMKFMRKMFQEKLINQDFPVVNSAQHNDYLFKSKGGIIANGVGNMTGNLYEPLYKTPGAQLDFVGHIQGPKGTRVGMQKGYARSFLFAKSKVKTEAQLREILSFYNKLSDPKMIDFLFLGIEGRHYKKKDGAVVEPNIQGWRDEMLDVARISPANPFHGRLQYGFGPLDKRLYDYLQNSDGVELVYNPTDSLVKNESIVVDDKLIDDARTKFIMGQLDEAGWKAAVEKWRKNNGDKLIEDFNAQFAKKQ